MTKLEMVNFIGESKMVIDFSKSFFMKKSKADVERFYKMSLEFIARQNKN